MMNPKKIALFVSILLIWTATAAEHHNSRNHIVNGEFQIWTKKYHPLSTIVNQKYLHPWTERLHHTIEISRQDDLQEIISKKKFKPTKINMCLFRSTRIATVVKQIFHVDNDGWYVFKASILAGSPSLMDGSLHLVIEKDHFLRSTKLRFPTDGSKQVLLLYVKLPTQGKYDLQLSLQGSQQNQIIAGITEVQLFQCTSTPLNAPFNEQPEPGNLVKNGKFSYPQIPKGVDAVKIFTDAAKPWFTSGMGWIVNCKIFNHNFDCNQAYLFAEYPEKVEILQNFRVTEEGFYQLCFAHTQTKISSQKGKIEVEVNDRVVYSAKVEHSEKRSRLTTKNVCEKIQLKQGSNSLYLVGQGFLVEKAGIMVTDVTIKFLSEEVPQEKLGSLTLEQQKEQDKVNSVTGGKPQESDDQDSDEFRDSSKPTFTDKISRLWRRR